MAGLGAPPYGGLAAHREVSLETNKQRYVLHHFPLVVDPVTASLEVQLALCAVLPDGRTERPGPRPVWRQLQRVQVTHASFPFSLNSRMVHFFGMNSKVEDCSFLLAYDSTGTLRYRINREEDEFVAYELSEELNGRPVIKPSIRLTFDDVESAQRFLNLVETLRSGGNIHPEGCDSLKQVIQSSRDVYFTSVAQKP